MRTVSKKNLLIISFIVLLTFAAAASAVPDDILSNLFSSGTPQHYYVMTNDGWRLSVFRYKPDAIKEGTAPVILCHGLHSNSNFWDLDESHSFARFLRNNGYDTWNINLRGSGDSSKPFMAEIRSLSTLRVSKWFGVLSRLPSSITKSDWTFDDHVNKDLPAIIEFVKSRTGKDRITWIGHSMGGMAMYGYLETHDQNSVTGFAALGSTMCVPEDFTKDTILTNLVISKGTRQLSLLINTTIASQIRNLTLGAVKLPWEDRFYNFENMDRLTSIRMFRIAVSDISRGTASQYIDMIENGHLRSYDKKYDYTENLYKVNAPILVTVGPKDPFGSMVIAQYAFDRISSRDKELIQFSKDAGYSSDYGHCDIIIGRPAAEEIFPVLLNWIEKRR